MSEYRKNRDVLLTNIAIPGQNMVKDTEGMDRVEWAKFVIRNRDERNYVNAYSIFSQEARAENPEAEYCLGLMYARGQGIGKDHNVALSWFQKAYDKGYRNAGYFLGKMYLSGLGTLKDPNKAIEMFTAVASQDARAMYELGLMYFTGQDVDRDLEKAFTWMSKAAEAGHSEAQFVVGQMYKSGAGTEKDIEKAVEWLSKAALNRHKGAQILLGNMYRTGDGVTADQAESDRWYDMADGKSNVGN